MSDRLRTETDVLVVGAGPTGLVTAIDLRRRGVDCRLVERNDSSVETSRALAIQPRTLQVFEDLGVLDDVLADGTRVRGATAYDGDQRLFRFDLDAVDASSPYPFLWFLPQNRTERLLVERFEELGGTVEFERELVGFGQHDEGVTATVRHRDGDSERVETIAAKWLVGCDGARSPVRTTLGLDLEGTTEPQEVLVADVRADWDLPSDEATLWFHEDGVVAALPMVETDLWRLFVDVTPTPPDERPEPTLAVLQGLLRERTNEADVTLTDAPWTSSFVSEQRLVSRYRSGRVFLAGDAAHVHNPLGGQGMNLGIQDAYNLAWKLALVLDDAAPERLLDSYETERRPVAADVLRTTGVSGDLLVTADPLLKRVRNGVLPRVVAADRVQARLFRAMTNLDVEYRDGPLSRVHGESPLADLLGAASWRDALGRARRAWSAPKAGERAPEAPCRTVDGRETTLYRELHGSPAFALLVFVGTDRGGTLDGHDELVGLAEAVEERTNGLVRPYLVVPETVESSDGETTVLVDTDGTLHERYDAAGSALYLLRPDDHVGFRSRPPRTEPLFAYLDEWLTLPATDERDGVELVGTDGVSELDAPTG